MNMTDYSYIHENVKRIRARMQKAAREAGRPDDAALVAAVKYADTDEVNYLHTECGINDIGENRVQQLLERWDHLKDRESLRIHFIGTLQPNKVKYIIGKVCLIHSLDSVKLAEEIEKRAKAAGLTVDVLVEINSGEETSKSGVLPKDVADFCRVLSRFPHIRHLGFMTMAPKCENSGDYIKYFTETYRLCLDIWYKILHNNTMPIMSMGMSESFEEAIRCGATVVRVGRALFAKPEAIPENKE